MTNYIDYIVDIMYFIITVSFCCIGIGSLLEFIKIRRNPSPKSANHDKRFKKVPNKLTQHVRAIEEA